MIVLESIQPRTIQRFEALVSETRKQAKVAGMKRGDIRSAVEAVRSRKRRSSSIRMS